MAGAVSLAGFEVQGRRMERVDGQRAVRNSVRLATESNMSAAVTTAENLVGEGFTAWIFEVKYASQSGKKSYRLLKTLSP